MKEQMTTTGNSAGISGKRAQTQFRKYLLGTKYVGTDESPLIVML